MPSIYVDLGSRIYLFSDGNSLLYSEGEKNQDELFVSGNISELQNHLASSEKTENEIINRISDDLEGLETIKISEEKIVEMISESIDRIEIGHNVDGHGESFPLDDWDNIAFGFLYGVRIKNRKPSNSIFPASSTKVSFDYEGNKMCFDNYADLKKYLTQKMIEQTKKEGFFYSECRAFGIYVEEFSIECFNPESVNARFRD